MTHEYNLIKRHYGRRRAERSKVPLIQHIDQGLRILEKLGAQSTWPVARAYCLHPLIQADDDLARFMGTAYTPMISQSVLILAMEYRNQANRWLSDKVYTDQYTTSAGVMTMPRLIGLPTAGPLPDVRTMLIADKVQNYSDFLKHHKDTHPRRLELDLYFKTWLKVLGVRMSTFKSCLEDRP